MANPTAAAPRQPSTRATPDEHRRPATTTGTGARLNGPKPAGSTGHIAAVVPDLGEHGGGGEVDDDDGGQDGLRTAARLGPGTPAAPGTSSEEPARLLGSGSPCGDLFPYTARSDDGVVEVALEVAISGQLLGSRIVDEAPRGQGFALAASHCVPRLRFSPARDGKGQAVASRSVVQLRFARHREAARAAL